MNKTGEVYGIVLFACILTGFLTGPTRGNAQIIEMEIELPAVFTLTCLPGNPKETAEHESNEKPEVSLHWLEIAGDENAGIIVQINNQDQPVRAYYINTGTFHAGDTIPFENNRASFILNRTDENVMNSPFFKAWIGLCDDTLNEVTIDYL